MKKWLFFIIIILIVAFVAALEQVKYVNNKYETAMANIKSYDLQLSKAKEVNTAYKLTISQLESFQDSVLKELYDTSKELKIKTKNLKSLQAISSSFSRNDTITLRDTIFKDSSLAVDTMIGDKWYSVRLGLKYPSEISVSPCFVSNKYVVVSSKKETVNPPKKFFLFRLFQKKHYVLHVDVVEKNPYVDNQSSKYIEIIK